MGRFESGTFQELGLLYLHSLDNLVVTTAISEIFLCIYFNRDIFGHLFLRVRQSASRKVRSRVGG
jgi:hypothetical protein